MKKLALATAAGLAGGILLAGSAWAQCTTIQDGTLVASTGETLVTGYDDFGYNYQGHMYNGRYCDYDRAPDGPYCYVDLIMKWNDAWLSNKDCDGDGKLDRHYTSDSYLGSEAWLTNHQAAWDEDEKGRMRKWTYFVKIVAAPEDATLADGVWYTAAGVEIGPVIWGSFAIVEEIYNDPFNGYHGALYISPAGPGFGHID